VITLEKVNKSFSGRRVLVDYDLQVGDGETFVIVGPSGIGKSVTLKHIVGLLAPDSGTIRVDGVDVTTASPKELREVRRKIGFLFQGGALINWMTVGENVELPLRENRAQRLKDDEIRAICREKLALVNMASETNKYPDAISGGMRKRAALARVLVANPGIVLYDEPTAGLDPRMSSTICNLINDVKRQFGVTAIVVTHDLPLAYAVGDRMGMMHLGKLIEVGTPAEVRASKNPIVRDFLEGRPIQSVEEESKLGLAP
jgi:phospholipid/cholesterol/gamma-HCH transport system ATP-binding protein